MNRTQNGWIQAYQARNAYWLHDGNPKRPHALLTSGKHSNGFFNSSLIIPDEDLLKEAASDLLDLLLNNDIQDHHIDGIAGPQTGATRLAMIISELVSSFSGEHTFWVSPAKNEESGTKSMVFSEKEKNLLPGHSLLLCDDVLTTSGSVTLAENAILAAGGKVLPYILVLVNRSGLEDVGGKKIISLINVAMPMWEPEDCELCPKGSEAIRPKGDNWKRLTAAY